VTYGAHTRATCAACAHAGRLAGSTSGYWVFDPVSGSTNCFPSTCEYTLDSCFYTGQYRVFGSCLTNATQSLPPDNRGSDAGGLF
jgi:hypothetical protein